jgi:hypothetical protein
LTQEHRFLAALCIKKVFIDYEKHESTIECSFRWFRMSLLPTTVPSSCATLDLIGAPGSNRDFCSALSWVFSSTPRQKPTGNRVSL